MLYARNTQIRSVRKRAKTQSTVQHGATRRRSQRLQGSISKEDGLLAAPQNLERGPSDEVDELSSSSDYKGKFHSCCFPVYLSACFENCALSQFLVSRGIHRVYICRVSLNFRVERFLGRGVFIVSGFNVSSETKHLRFDVNITGVPIEFSSMI